MLAGQMEFLLAVLPKRYHTLPPTITQAMARALINRLCKETGMSRRR